MTLVVHGDSDLNTQVTRAGELEVVGEYSIALELVSDYLITPELVLFCSGSPALVNPLMPRII